MCGSFYVTLDISAYVTSVVPERLIKIDEDGAVGDVDNWGIIPVIVYSS
jgi:hypothetical protein